MRRTTLAALAAGVGVTATLAVSGVAGAAGGKVVSDPDRVARLDKATSGVRAMAPVTTEIGDSGFRVSGENRYETAVALSREAWWDPSFVTAVYLVSGQNFPDALAVGASDFDLGPILLTDPNTLPPVVEQELARLQPCFVVVVGGPSAVSPSVAERAESYANRTLCDEPA